MHRAHPPWHDLFRSIEHSALLTAIGRDPRKSGLVMFRHFSISDMGAVAELLHSGFKHISDFTKSVTKKGEPKSTLSALGLRWSCLRKDLRSPTPFSSFMHAQVHLRGGRDKQIKSKFELHTIFVGLGGTEDS
jgi:hypothetical protein